MVDVDNACFEPSINEQLTAFCFGERTAENTRAIEDHLLRCDRCWLEFQRLSESVRVLRLDPRLKPSLPMSEVISLFGLSGKINRPFAGHRRFVVAVALLFGLEWTVGLWSELGYSYDRYGPLAWRLSGPVWAWAAAGLMGALWIDARATKAGQTNGLAHSITFVLGALLGLLLFLMLALPNERTILASIQTRTASGGYLKDVLFQFLPLLVFVTAPFHTIVQLQRDLASGRHELVLGVLDKRPGTIVPRGTLLLAPHFLTALLVLLGLIKLVGTNYMLDALTPGPYAQLFTAAGYISTALWLAIALTALVWYSNGLNELKREAVAASRLAAGDRPD
jgi:FtsH-binding integral membrane protein